MINMPKQILWQILWIVLFVSLALPGRAEVSGASASGFTVTQSVTTTASPKRAWQGMIEQIDQWWNPEHTWSGDAGNLYIKATMGGCFCEHLRPKGDVEHLRIIYINPGKEVRFDGALGPLQTMAAQGRMIWKVEPAQGGSTITFKYLISGSVEGGFEPIAPAVDGVIHEQIERLAGILNKP
jgi:hypothetical protein